MNRNFNDSLRLNYLFINLVSIATEEVDKIFGKNGKKKLKMLMKNEGVYSEYV